MPLTKTRMKLNRVIVPILLLAVVVAGFLFLPVRQWFMVFESHVKSLGALGPLAMVLIYVLCTVLLVPGSIVTVGAGT
ncbi:MAG TPA: hypothetical protein VHV54_20675, partial [Candidatus Binatia bacterium]|nr:hypothetical protein [Candidatus Binatia bacterium]